LNWKNPCCVCSCVVDETHFKLLRLP
jgi:hypothetical protein